MNWFHKLLLRVRALTRKGEIDARMDDEMRAHVEMQTQANMEAGMNSMEARYEALRQFGGMESVKEECREGRGVRWMETLWRDLRFGARQLRKNPGFAAVAVLTLSLGIGANTAIFSFVNAILLRPLPYPEPERLVMVFENHPESGSHKDAAGAPVLGEWRRQTTVFEGLAGRGGETYNLTGEGQPENLRAATISANMFSLLGVRPMLGRDFLPEEEAYGRHDVALFSHELWLRRFGGGTNIPGSSIQMNTESWIVVGLMPPQFYFPDQNSELWTPLAISPEQMRQRHNHSVLVYGRLKAGVSLEKARREMDETARRMAAADAENKGWGAEVHPLQEIVVGDYRPVLLALLGAVGLVLLVACANVANLLLARSTARAREFPFARRWGRGGCISPGSW